MHGELEILDVIPRKEGLELLGAAYSGMSDVIKGTQFDPAIPQDARIAENFLKPVNLFGARYSHYPCVGGVYAVFRLIKDDSEDIPTFEELWLHATTNPDNQANVTTPGRNYRFIRPYRVR
uniref:Uncharacterized protein n=1 Tax=Escherichia coli TaxID=562 RepID=A0A1U9XFS3_ECOLX|nr:hypothetical protein [Escherichia coli]AQZ20321.1 hypothetical protein pLishui142-1_00052 [Escherichia coli]